MARNSFIKAGFVLSLLVVVMGIALIGCLELFGPGPDDGGGGGGPANGGIEGKVTDAITGEPVEGEDVTTDPPTRNPKTDSDGKYSMLSISPGDYTVEASKEGYDPNTEDVTVESGEDAVADIELTPTVTSVEIEPTSASIDVGGTGALAATVTYSNDATDDDVEWSSSNESVATVSASSDAVVTGVASGNVTITATSNKDSSKSASAAVTVMELAATPTPTPSPTVTPSPTATASPTPTPTPASTISAFSGDGQSGTVGTVLANPFVVITNDVGGNPVSSVDVTFAVTAGGGSLSASSAKTGTDGKSSTALTLGPAVGINTVTATSPGLAGSPVTFNATGVTTIISAQSTVVAIPTTVAANGVSTSAVTVTLIDGNSNPISGHDVTVSSGTHSTTITPSSGTTDLSGKASFSVKSTQDGIATIKATDTTENVILANTASITFDGTPPSEVTNLAATPGNATAALTWTASTSSDVAGYKVYTKAGAGSYDAGVNVGNVTSYQKPGLTNGTAYTFKVTALDGIPNESAGEEVGPVTPVAPVAPESWDLKFNSPGGDDTAYSVAIDPADESVYVVGYGTNLVTGSSGRDWWIKKFDSFGVEDTVNWNASFSSTGTNNDYAYSVAVHPTNGSVYVVGSGFNLVGGGSSDDWWIKKFDSSGIEDTVNWNASFDSSMASDVAFSVAVAPDSSVYVVGWSTGGNFDWWIKKFDSNGNEITSGWNLNLDFSGGSDQALSVKTTLGGEIYVGGKTDPTALGGDWRIKKYNSAGTEDTSNKWDDLMDLGGNDNPYSLAIDPNDGSVYAAGIGTTGQFDWRIKKFSSSGVEDMASWDKTYIGGSGNSYALSVTVASDSSVYVVGDGLNVTGASGDRDWWLKKFDSGGNEDTVNWDKKITGNGNDSARSVAVTPDGSSVYVVGIGANLLGATGNDWWIKKFTSNGVEK